MGVVVITGSAGLIGSEAARFFSDQTFHIVGIDNDMRRAFFGDEGSTAWRRAQLEAQIPNYEHNDIDIRDENALRKVFTRHGNEIEVVIHAAAQPSHDWAANEPLVDFTINAHGTALLLENTRLYCPRASFIFTSTNKVYGDHPNRLPLVEMDTRWEVDSGHPFFEHGIDESMSVDQTTHSLFGASKLAADALVQEYGRFFGMNTVCFRGGCLSGPNQAGTMLHGFLAYLMKCAVRHEPYTVFGYQGKQVRDNIHSFDLVNMFWHYHRNPRPGEVYNVGGGRHSHCSMREAISMCEEVTGEPMEIHYSDDNRIGDHIWYISDTRRFQTHYPDWRFTYDLPRLMHELHAGLVART